MTTLKEALRLVGITDEKEAVHIVPVSYSKNPRIYGEVMPVEAVRKTFDLKRTYVDRIDCVCPDGQFLFWEFHVFKE